MSKEAWIENRVGSVAGALKRFGQIGFWIQLVFLVVVVLLGVYTWSQGAGATFGNILAFLVLGLPVFTTFWCRRYASVGVAMSTGGARPSSTGLKRQLWTGIWAGTIGSGASLISLFGAASALLFTMLANPQIGIQVSPAPGTPTAYTISAIDAVSIMSLLLTLTAELIVVFISLRLLFLVEHATRSETGQ